MNLAGRIRLSRTLPTVYKLSLCYDTEGGSDLSPSEILDRMCNILMKETRESVGNL